MSDCGDFGGDGGDGGDGGYSCEDTGDTYHDSSYSGYCESSHSAGFDSHSAPSDSDHHSGNHELAPVAHQVSGTLQTMSDSENCGGCGDAFEPDCWQAYEDDESVDVNITSVQCGSNRRASDPKPISCCTITMTLASIFGVIVILIIILK